MTEALAPVQRKEERRAGLVQRKADAAEGGAVMAAAQHGVSSTPEVLPHRDRIQALFGSHDVSGIRSHVGGLAAEASRQIGASAYTIGSSVAFREPPDLHTAAHEAAHVVQQRGGVQLRGGAGEVGDAYERHADAVADAVVAGKPAGGILDQVVTGSSRSLGVQKKPGDPPDKPSAPKTPRAGAPGPATYDSTRHTIIAMPAGITVADMETNLDQEKAAGTISSWEAEGVRRGSAEHLYILYAIWQLSHTKSWDREVDLITEIGPGKRGAISVRIDAGGKAVGSLVSKAEPTVAAVYATVADAIAGLKARYKLNDVKGEKGKSWSVAELNKVAAAWSRLSPQEAAALEGFVLIRTDDNLQTPDGKLVAGLTTTGDEVAPDQLASTRVRELSFADRTFAGDTVSFVGDTENAAPSSIQTILHEVGHAQERKASADADSAYVEAQVERNRAADRANKQAQATLDAITAANDTWRKMSHAKRTASKGYADAIGAAFRAIDALRADPDVTKAATLQQAARAAVQARNTARDALPTTSPAVPAFATALTEQDAYLAAAEALMASRQAVETTKANKGAKHDTTGTRSARLQRFVDFVNRKGIKPFTQYAKDNWPSHPEEFYAEAFSFWHADPKFLDSSAPELKTWFAGEHLK